MCKARIGKLLMCAPYFVEDKCCEKIMQEGRENIGIEVGRLGEENTFRFS